METQKFNTVILALSAGHNLAETGPSCFGISVANKVVELARDNPMCSIVLSGWYAARLGHAPARSEAEHLRDIVVSQGVDPARIALEEKSMDSIGGIYFSSEVIDGIEQKNGKFDQMILASAEFMSRRVNVLGYKMFADRFYLRYEAAEEPTMSAIYGEVLRNDSDLKMERDQANGYHDVGSAEEFKNIVRTKHALYCRTLTAKN